ncbi:hypothetical protein BV20DRAFT_383078 [Pilatotrama ljubarskyi]|nr:hypothetical protein BV20DRAFT_383078 [Pilatotrama ljubarskyi]
MDQPTFGFTFTVTRSAPGATRPAADTCQREKVPATGAQHSATTHAPAFQFRPPSPRLPRANEAAARVSPKRQSSVLAVVDPKSTSTALHARLAYQAAKNTRYNTAKTDGKDASAGKNTVSEEPPDGQVSEEALLKAANIVPSLENVDHTAVMGDSVQISTDLSEYAPPCGVQLITLNADVQEEIYLWLSGSSLSALMRTCRHFSEAALPALCRRAGQPFTTYWQLLSFHKFLQRPSSIPRPPLILRLHVALSVHELDQDDRGACDVFLGIETFPRTAVVDLLLDVLHLCRNLRHLNLNLAYIRIERGLLCKTISMMPYLEELSIPLPEEMAVRDYRRLARPPLRALTFYSGGPESLNSLSPFSMSVVDLHIPNIREWPALQSYHIFPRVQRLEIGTSALTPSGFPQELKRVFPNLRYLSMSASAADEECGLDDDIMASSEVEGLRDHHRRQREAEPENWPKLVLLAYRHSCAAYTYALPLRISSLSVLVDVNRGMTPHEQLSRAVIADAKPSCLELRMRLSKDSFKSAGSVEEDAAQKPFSILPASSSAWSPLRCILTLELDLGSYSSVTHLWYARSQSTMLEALERQLPGLPLTHLLMKYSLSGTDQVPRWYLMEEETELSIVIRQWQETALRVACASRTLRWIGIYVETVGLRSWNVVRVQDGEPDAKVVLEELDEQGSRKVIAAEEMEELALHFRPRC